MPLIANILGTDTLIVVGLIVLLFGGSQLPKLARSLGSAKAEFERGQKDAEDESRPDRDPGGPTTTNSSPRDDTEGRGHL